MDCYNLGIEDVLKKLQSNQHHGLNDNEAATKLDQYGNNELRGEEKTSWFTLLAVQFKNPLIIILLIGARSITLYWARR